MPNLTWIAIVTLIQVEMSTSNLGCIEIINLVWNYNEFLLLVMKLTKQSKHTDSWLGFQLIQGVAE